MAKRVKKSPEKGKKFESIKGKTGKLKKEEISRIASVNEKKRVDMIKEEEKRGRRVPLLYAVLIIVVAGVIGAVLIFLPPPVNLNTEPVKSGDVVQIAYVGMLENGSVFNSGNFTFTTGQGEAIEGVEEAVIGMRMGEKKTVSIPPEEAYGHYDPEFIMDIPLVQELNRTSNTTVELFELSFEREPEIGEVYEIEGMEWPVRVTDLQNDTVTISHEPDDGMAYELTDEIGEVYGTARVSVTTDTITITTEPILESVVVTVMGEGRIVEVNETHMKMDFNHWLAGETLIFEIRLLNFISQ